MATSNKCEAASTELACERELLDKNFKDWLIQDISALYMSREYSDVILLVGEEQIYAHKFVLAARNPYFSALLFGGLEESSKKEIELKDVGKGNLSAFKALLKYLYCGILPFEELTPSVLLDLARLANLYNCTQIEKVTIKYLDKTLNTDNVLALYSQAADYHFDEVIHICLAYMDKNAVEVMKRSEFNSLTKDCVIYFSSRDSIGSDEFGIFQAVQSWIQANPDADATELLSNVRLHLIPVEHIVTSVNRSGFYTSSSLMAALEKKWDMDDTKFQYCRTASSPGIHLTDILKDARVIVGERTSSNHDLLWKTSDSDNKGYTWHKIVGNPEDGILIDLSCRRIVNHMQMLLTDTEEERYRYYIEVSLDQKRWVRVVDHRGAWCFGLQDLYFELIIAQYIRIVGTKCTHTDENNIQYFSVSHFEVKFTNEMKELNNGLLVAKENVATLVRGARVRRHGEGENIEGLLSHDSTRRATVSCEGYFEVQLPQPYVVNSMRFFLPENAFHFYNVVVFNNSEPFEVASISSEDLASRGWQNIRFEKPTVVSVIKIHAVNAEYCIDDISLPMDFFYCNNFECPSSIQDLIPFTHSAGCLQ